MNQLVAMPRNAIANWTSRQLDTIKRTVAKDTNDDEFNLYIEYARVKGLDPFSKQVIAVVYNKTDAEKRQMTIITTQDGCRVLASRCRDYRPEETEPEYEYNPDLKGPTNPLGIVKATVKLWKQDNNGVWFPVNGTAYWDEFVPLKTSDAAFEWIETGEFWPNRDGTPGNRPKKRKQLRDGAVLEQAVDSSGQWAKMPRNQIAKCARMQGLRGGWPETFSGVYAPEEMDRTAAIDATASEMVDMEREAHRARLVSMVDDEYPFVDHQGTLTFIPAGRYGSEVITAARNCTTAGEFDSMKIRNREGLQRFWVKHKSDALEINKELESIRAQLSKPAP